MRNSMNLMRKDIKEDRIRNYILVAIIFTL